VTDEPRRPEQLAEWIRANRAAYTRDALDRAIAEQGWSEEEIAAAWRMAESGGSTSEWARADTGRRGLADKRAELLLLAIVLVPLTILAVLAESSFGSFGGSNGPSLLVLLGMALTVAIPVAAVVLVARRRLALGCAGLVGLAAVLGLAIFGTCILTINAGVPR